MGQMSRGATAHENDPLPTRRAPTCPQSSVTSQTEVLIRTPAKGTAIETVDLQMDLFSIFDSHRDPPAQATTTLYSQSMRQTTISANYVFTDLTLDSARGVVSLHQHNSASTCEILTTAELSPKPQLVAKLYISSPRKVFTLASNSDPSLPHIVGVRSKPGTVSSRRPSRGICSVERNG